jgi:hypothetical protein
MVLEFKGTTGKLEKEAGRGNLKIILAFLLD